MKLQAGEPPARSVPHVKNAGASLAVRRVPVDPGASGRGGAGGGGEGGGISILPRPLHGAVPEQHVGRAPVLGLAG
jgi:hypothetical protein